MVDKLSVKNIYKFEAREDVSPYSEIGKMDLPPGHEVTILESSYPGYFSVHPTNGILRSEARLDHEANPRVVLNIKITAPKNEELFSQVIVDITDVNDNAPEFAVPLVVLSVPEDFPSGENARVLYVCTATDADSDLNGKLTYKLRNEDSRFSIDPVTAEIRLMLSLDYELETQHEIVIEAEDSGQPRLKSSMKLTLLVHDVNDNEPVFDNATYTGRIVQVKFSGYLNANMSVFALWSVAFLKYVFVLLEYVLFKKTYFHILENRNMSMSKCMHKHLLTHVNTLKYTMTQINFLPPPDIEPGSLGTVSR